MSLRRALSRSTGAALAAVTALTALPLPAAAAPAYTLQERAQAIAQPAAVFLESQISGVVRDKATGNQISEHQVTVLVRCSGFVVNPSGIAITLRSCVAPTQSQIDAWAFEAYANTQVADKKIAENQRDGLIAQLRQTSVFTGESADQPPATNSFAQMNVATAGATTAPAWPAEMQAPVDSDSGLAIMKIAQGNLPAVEVNANAQVSTVQTPVAMGYVAVDNKTLTLRARPVNVSGPYEKGGDTAHKLDGALSWESRGGLVADLDGRAVGVAMPDLQGQIDVVTDSAAIVAELSAHGLKSELSKTDLRYRQALDLYYGGKYAEAIDAFEQVIKEAPANQTAAAFRKQAQDRLEIEGGSSSLPVWVIILLSVLGTALIAGVVTVFILRQRRSVGHGPDSLNPTSVNPFASPTSGAGYPMSGGGYPATAWSNPVSTPPMIDVRVAPPGTPVPYPPIHREVPAPQEATALAHQEPTEAQEEAVHAPPVQPEIQPTSPAAATASQPTPTPTPTEAPPSQPQQPFFAWPEDDAPSDPHSDANPWAPR